MIQKGNKTFELQVLERHFSKLAAQCLIDHALLKLGVLMLRDRQKLILPKISTEFFILFQFKLKSSQFIIGKFSLFSGALSDIMEEFKLIFSFAEAVSWIAFYSALSALILCGYISIGWWFVNIRANVRIWF